MIAAKWMSAALGAVLCAGVPAWAQNPTTSAIRAYPDKPVRVIIPFAAGGAADIIARAYGHKFADKFGQS